MKTKLKLLINYILLNYDSYYKLVLYLEDNYYDYFLKNNIDLNKYKEYNKINVDVLGSIIYKYILKNIHNKELINKLVYDLLNIHPDKDIILNLFSNNENNIKKSDGEKLNTKPLIENGNNKKEEDKKEEDKKEEKSMFNKYNKYLPFATFILTFASLLIILNNNNR